MRRGLAYLVVIVAIGGGIVGGVNSLSSEPNEIRIKVEPTETIVAAGETFTIELTIENINLNSVEIQGIGFDSSLLDGVSVEQMDPAQRSVAQRNYPLYGKWDEYKLNRTLLGGNKLNLVITLRAKEAGQYGGDVTVWVKGNLVGLPVSRARRAALDITVQ